MSTLNYKNYSIFYQIDNPNSDNTIPIILLNGIMMSAASWDIFKDAFSENNTLIRFDMIDQGLSSKSQENYTQEIQVDILHELMNHLNIDKANIVGISYGASVALQFAIKHQDKVNKLVIANGVAKTSKWLKAIGDGWIQVGKKRDGEAYYNITIPYIYSPMFYEKSIEWMEERKKILIPLFSNPDFLDSMERLTISAETHDTTKELHSIKRNTLIISSEYDFLTPTYEQDYLHKNIAHSQLHMIYNCGHASMYEVPELFTELILDFCKGDKQ